MTRRRRCLALAVLFLARVPAFAAEVHRDALVTGFANERPRYWGMEPEGTVTRAKDAGKAVALTFDACDGRKNGYDRALIGWMIENEIPATLFINARWIDAHRSLFLELAANPLFEIENHGTRHRPLSVTGKSAYGIRGTADVGEAFDEVEGNAEKIEALTGKRPRFFRSGTAHYDDVAARLVRAMGYGIAGFAVNGDDGATAPARTVKRNLLSVRGGEVVLCHMNHPGSGTYPGIKQAVPLLKERGFRFVRLSELAGPEKSRPIPDR